MSKRPRKMPSLPIPDAAVLAAAELAYRLAVLNGRRVDARWERRGAELRRLDEFHRTRVAWENAHVLAEWLCEEAGDLVLCVLRRAAPFQRSPLRAECFRKRHDRDFVRALVALDHATTLASQGGPS